MIKTTAVKGADTVKVTFALPADTPPASVVGEFNDWDPLANPLKKRSNGTRSAAVELPAGTAYRFRYLLDGGDWLDEPETETVRNDDGTVSSVIVL